MPKQQTSDLKKKLLAKKPAEVIDWKSGLSTGSTLLNLACSGRPSVGFLPGKYYFFVGDSRSGKTFLSLTCFAEAMNNPAFQNHRLIHDNAEDGALMNIAKFFGKKVADRIESPSTDNNGPVYSQTVEDFYFHLDDAFQLGKPFVYVLDSMDVISSDAEEKKFETSKVDYRKGKELTGSFGDGKAKKNSANLRLAVTKLSASDSILIIINQTRDNIGFGAQFTPKTRAGGHALTFYATIEMWSSIKARFKKTVRGISEQTGILSKVSIKKNRLTGRESSVEIPIYWSTGIDDVGSCIRFLINRNHWNGTQEKVDAPEFGFKGSIDGLVELIESDNKEKELKAIVAEVWNDIESQCEVTRKRRYE